ncbi:Sec-independent protein translocase subunit TatA [Kineosporia babensis]|uniref:Sec-independent protein translocase protein TatA n=1 Tax=Kineosporia babensis TaxID=499548 RepID=A0A9X1SU67_9ACTN|nr:Sec-independent protein translocase subunit TatA [Kineosporia babensis]MCD5312131.1 Sec-independent protein translocase subunit TatA [Kineosporia babensis]
MGFLKEPSHIIIMILVLVILFGSRRLPDAARGLGRSMRIFKSEIKQMKQDDNPTPADEEAAQRKAQAEELRRQADALESDPPLEGRVMTPQQPGYQSRTDV